MLGQTVLPISLIVAMTTLTAVSAVNIAICRSKVDGSAFPGSIQGTSVDVARDCAQTNVTVVGLCNVGASSGRNRLLFGESLIVALRSGSIQSDALYPHNGEGVVCDLDLSAKKKSMGRIGAAPMPNPRMIAGSRSAATRRRAFASPMDLTHRALIASSFPTLASLWSEVGVLKIGGW